MICLVGDILNDVTLATSDTQLKMRLGGIVHAARGLWAMGIDYAIAYFAPSYMDSHILCYLQYFGCKQIIKLGNVVNCPYTMLIKEVKEIGQQGYDFLLRDDILIDYDDMTMSSLAAFDDIVMISGNYNMQRVLAHVSSETQIHYDVSNNMRDINELISERKAETLFVSTSSDLFKNRFIDTDSFLALLQPYAKYIVLKENRGGSIVYDSFTGMKYNIPSQTSPIQHSVGVGDVYDVVFISAPYQNANERALLASWVAREYAVTTFPEDFNKATKGVIKLPVEQLLTASGCFLPWETRQKCHIYIAAPDFDFIDRIPIDMLCESLRYHNFVPHRPILENGQMTAHADCNERAKLFSDDMALYEKCNMLIAVLLYNDPGTLIEIGMAAQKGIPTLVYDPYRKADNCMLTELPYLVSSDMDVIMSKVFNEYSRMYANETL